MVEQLESPGPGFDPNLIGGADRRVPATGRLHRPGRRGATAPYRNGGAFLTPPDARERDHHRVTDDQPAEFLLEGYPPAIRDTGRRLRALIFETVDGTVETVRTGWRWVAYSLPEKGRVRNFAWIGPERKHIHLGFENGVLLADPDRVLHGAEERLRKFRYFTFEPDIDIDETVLANFIRRAADLATMPADARRALAETRAEPVASGGLPADIELELVED